MITANLFAFQTFYVNSNRNGSAYIEIRTYPMNTLVHRIPTSGEFSIYQSYNVQHMVFGLESEFYYEATCYAHSNSTPTYFDSDNIIFEYGTGSETFQIDISGIIPDDPPAGY